MTTEIGFLNNSEAQKKNQNSEKEAVAYDKLRWWPYCIRLIFSAIKSLSQMKYALSYTAMSIIKTFEMAGTCELSSL